MIKPGKGNVVKVFDGVVKRQYWRRDQEMGIDEEKGEERVWENK